MKDTPMLLLAFLSLFVLAVALAWAKGTSAARPRGRFAPSFAWDLLPSLPAAPRVRQRALGLARSLGLL